MAEYELHFGNISRHLEIEHCTIRTLHDPGLDEDDEEADFRIVAQGHIKNISGKAIEDLNIDITYVDQSSNFLGLDKTGMLDTDSLEKDETLPFSIDLEIPEETHTLVINATGKTHVGLFSWLLGT